MPGINELAGKIHINNQLIVETSTGGMRYSFSEAIAYASWEEQLYAGEFFGSGTLPGGSGIENGHLLKSGDSIKLEIEGVGTLENFVA